MDSLTYYRGTGYGPINNLLRSAFVPISMDTMIEQAKGSFEYETLQHIRNIDNTLRVNSQYTNKVLYRGVPGYTASKGDILVNRGFTSASFLKKGASAFLDDEKCCLIYFAMPPGLKTYRYNPTQLDIIQEEELLIQRNTEFLIVGTHADMYFAELREHFPEPPKPEHEALIQVVLQNTGNKLEDDLDDFFNDDDTELDQSVDDLVADFQLLYNYNDDVAGTIRKRISERTSSL